MMNRVRPSIQVSCFLLFALCLSTRALALNNASVVTGIVVDPTGAIVRGATVDVIAHNEKLSTVSTDQQGQYTVSVPAAGSYEIRVSAPGFKTATADNLAVRGSEEGIRNFTLRLDALSAEVTVTATATPTLESHLGAAVSVLGSSQLAGTDEVQEPLRWIPGMQMTQT
jgi:vitamin B12 transporter